MLPEIQYIHLERAQLVKFRVLSWISLGFQESYFSNTSLVDLYIEFVSIFDFFIKNDLLLTLLLTFVVRL